VHLYDFTTNQISSKYVDKYHTDHGGKDIELNQFKNRDVPYGGTHAPVASDLLRLSALVIL
jgi:hypothetical protein